MSDVMVAVLVERKRKMKIKLEISELVADCLTTLDC